MSYRQHASNLHKQGMSFTEVGKAMGIGPTLVRQALKRVKSAQFVSNNLPTFHNKHLVLTGPHMIISDIHAPFHSDLWLNRFFAVADKHKIRRAIIGGDGIDLHNFSCWGGDPNINWDEESAAAAELVWHLYHNFEKVYWFRGNHEDRIARKTDWQMKATGIIKSLLLLYADEHKKRFVYDADKQKLVCSNMPICELDDWLIVHPRSYSRIPLRVANQLALVRNKNVIAAHSHRAGVSWADNGRMIIDSGGGFDEQKVQYRYEAITTHGNWQNGFVTYHGPEHVEFMGPSPQTDWSQYD